MYYNDDVFEIIVNSKEIYITFSNHSCKRAIERAIEISVLMDIIKPAVAFALNELKVGDIIKKEEVVFFFPEYKISAVTIVGLIDFVIKTVVLNGFYDGMTSAAHGQKIIKTLPDGTVEMTVNP